jgi:hypothetical protein
MLCASLSRYAECCYTDWHYAQCQCADCRFAGCNCAQCHFAEYEYTHCYMTSVITLYLIPNIVILSVMGV